MVDVNIKQNQGIISAIRAKLQDKGVQVKDTSWNLWEKVIEQVKTQNKENITDGKKEIYSGDENIKGDGHKNFVVQQGIITFSEKIWNNIKSLFTEKNTNVPPKTKAEETAKDDVLIQNKTNTIKAINTITQNIDKISTTLNLPKEKINEALCKLQKTQPDIPTKKVSIGDMTASLLVDLLKEIIPNAKDNDINFKAIKIASELLPDDTIGNKKTKDLDDNAIRKLLGIENTTQTSPISSYDVLNKRLEEHRKVVNDAISKIEQHFDKSPLGKHFKAQADKQLFLQCLREITYDSDKTGAGHEEAGIIHIETNNEEVNTLSQMTKLLIHEANHAFLSRKSKENGTLKFPTKAEEMECETLALTTIAYMIKNDIEDKNGNKLENYQIYEKDVTYFENEKIVKNDNGFKNWLNGYQQLADNLDGDITIQHNPYNNDLDQQTKIQIKSGDVIVLKEKDSSEVTYTIGKNDTFIEGINDNAVAQLVKHKRYYDESENNKSPNKYAMLTFDDLPPSKQEKENVQLGKIKGSFVVKRYNEQGELEIIYNGTMY